MNLNGTPVARPRKLEATLTPPRKCQTCSGHPTRLVYIDPETEETWWERLSERGCPECGAPILRELRVIFPDDGSGEPPI